MRLLFGVRHDKFGLCLTGDFVDTTVTVDGLWQGLWQ